MRFVLPLVVWVLAMMAVMLLWHLRPQVQEQPVEELPLVVRLGELSQATLPALRRQGQVEAPWTTQLAAALAAPVLWMDPELARGVQVVAGQALVRLDSQAAQALLAARQAELAQAHEALAQEESQGALALRDWLAQGLDPAQAPALVLRKPQATSAQARLAAAQAALTQAQAELERCTVRAPHAGRVVALVAQVGEWVSPGRTLLSIQDSARLEVVISVPDDELSLLALEQVVRVRPARGEGAVPWSGHIAGWLAAVDPQTRQRQCRIRLDLTSSDAPPPSGLLVTVELPRQAPGPVLSVPEGAWTADGRLRVVDRESRIALRDVAALARHDGHVYLAQSAYQDGDRPCVSPVDDAVGRRVQEVESP